jgi:transcription antitermination factor NusG
MVGYTLPLCERILQTKLQRSGVECFLPMRRETRSWTDRQKTVDVPVFPNYIFIRTTMGKRFELLNNRELVKYITFDGEPATVRDEEISLLQLAQQHQADTAVVPQRQPLQPGCRVTINAGKFAGAKGVLMREGDKNKVVVELTAVRHLIKLHVDASQVSVDECAY